MKFFSSIEARPPKLATDTQKFIFIVIAKAWPSSFKTSNAHFWRQDSLATKLRLGFRLSLFIVAAAATASSVAMAALPSYGLT